jgi:hypothetical protein
MTRMPRCFLGLCLLAAGLTRADAGIITVQNSSFESPALANPGDFTRIAPDSWTMTGQGGVFQPVAGGVEVFAIPDGVQVGWLYSGGSFFQDLGVLVDPSTNYQLDLFVGTQLDNPAPGVGYRVDLVAGGVSGTVVAEATGTLSAASDFVPVSIAGIGVGSGDLGILITATGGQPLFDDIRVQASPGSQAVTLTPEPSTLVIWSFVAGMFGFVQPYRLRRGTSPA